MYCLCIGLDCVLLVYYVVIVGHSFVFTCIILLFIYLEILSVLSEVVYPSTSTRAEVCMYILLSVHTWVLIVVCIPLSCPRLSKPCPTYVHM